MPTFIAFSLVLFFYVFHASPFTTPTLIALNCTQISNQTILYNNTKALLGNLTNKAEKTKFVTSKTNNQHTCLMQCKLDTSQPICSSCIKHAKSSTLGLGSSSKLVAAWFDGCYLDYAQENQTYIIITSFVNLSCLGKVATKDKGHFSIETDHGIAYGEVSYVENGMNISMEEQCGGKVEGLAVFIEGQCLVWLKILCSNITCSNISHGGSRSRNIGNLKNGDGDYNVGHIKREFMFIWVIGFAIVATVGVCGCLVRRSIVNRAKVASISGGEGDDKV